MKNQNLESEKKKKDDQSQVVSQQDYYWITTPNQALFKELKIISGVVAPQDTLKGLYYPHTSKGLKEAKGMLRKIKEAIYCYNSTSKFPQRWITKKWLNEKIQVRENIK